MNLNLKQTNKLSSRIRTAREHAGFTQKELADRVGISQTAVHKLECGRSRSSRRTVAIAMTCGVDPVWLETGQGDMVTGGGASLAMSMSPYHNEPVGALAEQAETYRVEETESPSRVPLISWEEAVNWGKSLISPRVSNWVSAIHRINPLVFALKVSGDSMEIEFTEGDILLVDPTKKPLHKQYVVVGLAGEDKCTFKQLIIDGGQRYLKPLNPRYPIIAIDEKTMFCGVVVAKFKEF
ncbi:MAG: LexA family transcriptional regulator [Magnetococcales bacterium]|nr:LexA family transcriptional regulator [Magnetococcales bacterium]MBF0321715.1 LexA family transcriptional regulator [Magnetococcales bacterium]